MHAVKPQRYKMAGFGKFTYWTLPQAALTPLRQEQADEIISRLTVNDLDEWAVSFAADKEEELLPGVRDFISQMLSHYWVMEDSCDSSTITIDGIPFLIAGGHYPTADFTTLRHLSRVKPLVDALLEWAKADAK